MDTPKPSWRNTTHDWTRGVDVDTNRRRGGAWTQRYEHGVPVSDLEPIAGEGTTGTAVHFRPDASLRAAGGLAAGELVRLAASWPVLSVEVDDRRAR